MYCVSLQHVRQCNPQRVFPFAEGMRISISKFIRNKCTQDPFYNRAKNLEILGLLALFFVVIFTDNIIKENL